MNAASYVQSTHGDDPSHKDDLEHDDPKMDRAVQPAHPHVEVSTLEV